MAIKAFPSYLAVMLLSSCLLLSGCSGIVSFLPSVTPTHAIPPTSTLPLPSFTSIPLTPIPIPTNTLAAPTDTPLPTDTATLAPPTETSTLPAPVASSEEPFVMVRVDPSQGSLTDLLAQEFVKAQGMGLTPVVYFDATW
jgi:hypothetical protein